jgi:hypothetical protein
MSAMVHYAQGSEESGVCHRTEPPPKRDMIFIRVSEMTRNRVTSGPVRRARVAGAGSGRIDAGIGLDFDQDGRRHRLIDGRGLSG